MNRKSYIIIIAVIVILIIGAIILFLKNNNSTSNNQNIYEANKTSTNNSNNSDNQNNQTEQISQSQEQSQNNQQSVQTPYVPVEEQIATYSTKIYSQDSARQNNIVITCKTLNGTTVKNGSTFSFCQTVGPSTTSKGYQKADIYDNNGKKKKGLGGGNCQISTTLYNAVLEVPSLKVTERHAHSNKVPYISPGKDAAVAYGSYDLKFLNNSGNDIKIYSESSSTAINVRLVSLK